MFFLHGDGLGELVYLMDDGASHKRGQHAHETFAFIVGEGISLKSTALGRLGGA